MYISDDCNHSRTVEDDENIRAKYLTNIYWHSRILYFEKKNYENMKIYCSQIFKKVLYLLKKISRKFYQNYYFFGNFKLCGHLAVCPRCKQILNDYVH
jgi:hypothetical protein